MVLTVLYGTHCILAISSLKIIEKETPWYGSVHLNVLNRTISACPGFYIFKQSYFSEVPWPVPLV